MIYYHEPTVIIISTLAIAINGSTDVRDKDLKSLVRGYIGRLDSAKLSMAGCSCLSETNDAASLFKMVLQVEGAAPGKTCRKKQCAAGYSYMFPDYDNREHVDNDTVSCYRFYPYETLKRNNARKTCLLTGGDLVSIESEEEMKHLKKTIEKYLLVPLPPANVWPLFMYGYWTSGTDYIKEGDWIWEATGEKIERYKNWGVAEPNDFHGEDYMFLQMKWFTWVDVNVRYEEYALCEKKPTCVY